MKKTIQRCAWASGDPLLIAYHDREWGAPVHEDGKLFEFLILEGVQAGLSWLTVLRKRENYRAAFGGFDPAVVAGYKENDVQRLLTNEGIIRNRLKIEAAITNANKLLDIQEEFGSFDAYIWTLSEGNPKKRPRIYVARQDTGHDRRVRSNEQGLEKTRFQVRRTDHLLCFHAGGRNGERSHDRMSQTREGPVR